MSADEAMGRQMETELALIFLTVTVGFLLVVTLLTMVRVGRLERKQIEFSDSVVDAFDAVTRRIDQPAPAPMPQEMRHQYPAQWYRPPVSTNANDS